MSCWADKQHDAAEAQGAAKKKRRRQTWRETGQEKDHERCTGSAPSLVEREKASWKCADNAAEVPETELSSSSRPDTVLETMRDTWRAEE